MIRPSSDGDDDWHCEMEFCGPSTVRWGEFQLL